MGMMRRSRVLGIGFVVLAVGGLVGCTPVQPWDNSLVSINATATNSGGNPSDSASISADGTKVAFRSDADDLVTNDHNSTGDVFVRDLATVLRLSSRSGRPA